MTLAQGRVASRLPDPREGADRVVIAYVIDQMIGMALLGFFAGWVCADAARPRPRRRRVQAGAEDPAKPKKAREVSGSQ
jgi:hypothetical protein